MGSRQYLCIDQKSFCATVDCVARDLDPMKAKLVVADPERSQNTICLAVSPALKAIGVKTDAALRRSQPILIILWPCPVCNFTLNAQLKSTRFT